MWIVSYFGNETKKNRKYLVFKKVMLFIIGILINLIALVIFVVGVYFISIDNKVLKKDNGDVYFSLQHESMPFDISICDFEDFQKELLNTKYYTYYEMYGQPLFLSEEILDIKENNIITEEGKFIIESMQVGKRVCEDFGIDVREGRRFEETDYMVDTEKTIPVLIGNDLAINAEIGDTFQVEYLYDVYECTIIGILKPESMIYMTNKTYLLDNRIVMPSFEISEGSNVTDGIKIHYANKVSGIIKAEKGKERQAIKYLNSCIKNTSTGKYSWYSTLIDINLRHTFHVGIYEILVMDIVVCFLMNAFIRRKVRRNK